MADPSAYPGMPRWARLQGTLAAVLVLLVLAMAAGLTGHGAPGTPDPAARHGGH